MAADDEEDEIVAMDRAAEDEERGAPAYDPADFGFNHQYRAATARAATGAATDTPWGTAAPPAPPAAQAPGMATMSAPAPAVAGTAPDLQLDAPVLPAAPPGAALATPSATAAHRPGMVTMIAPGPAVTGTASALPLGGPVLPPTAFVPAVSGAASEAPAGAAASSLPLCPGPRQTLEVPSLVRPRRLLRKTRFGLLDEVWTENEGEETENDEEIPAAPDGRGWCCLVTASCPRKYPRTLAERKGKNIMIPEDYSRETFLENFRQMFNRHTPKLMTKGTCHEEPHKRFRRTRGRRERHYHLAMKATGPFAFMKLTTAFKQKYGIQLSFSFKMNHFAGYLGYLMRPGKKPSTDLDLKPATYPPSMDLKAELKQTKEEQASKGKKRKRLSFDEFSNVVIEGVGAGPLRTGKAVEETASRLKDDGNVELWNYVGDFKTAKDVNIAVSKVWRLRGDRAAHPLFHMQATYPLEAFSYQEFQSIKQWLEGKWKTHTLVLSGDGGLGKSGLGEALLMRVCPGGFWFLDDPDDFRELDGLLEQGHGLMIDEITLYATPPNQIKKLFDLEKTRRVQCRHFNGTIPQGCPRIVTTNSELHEFYPAKMSKQNRTGVMRRQLFEHIDRDVRVTAATSTVPLLPVLAAASTAPSQGDWGAFLERVCVRAHVAHHVTQAHLACEQLGVALQEEVVEAAADIARRIGMKPFESRRFIAAVQE